MTEVNKVEMDGQTLIDLTGDTVTEADVIEGKQFHKASGEITTGELVVYEVGYYLTDEDDEDLTDEYDEKIMAKLVNEV